MINGDHCSGVRQRRRKTLSGDARETPEEIGRHGEMLGDMRNIRGGGQLQRKQVQFVVIRLHRAFPLQMRVAFMQLGYMNTSSVGGAYVTRRLSDHVEHEEREFHWALSLITINRTH